MHHGLAARRSALDQLGVGNVPLDKLKQGVVQLQVVALARGEVVDDAHGVATRQQGVTQVGADEAGTAGDQDGGISHGDRTGPEEAASLHARHGA